MVHLKRTVICGLLWLSLRTSQSLDSDVDEMLNGVQEYACGDNINCNPGMLVVFDARAFPVLSGVSGGIFRPVVAASLFGQGRIVAFAHEGMLSVAKEHLDDNRFLLNTVKWASDHNPSTSSKKIAILKGHSTAQPLADFLNKNSYDAQTIDYDLLADILSPTALHTLIIPQMTLIREDIVAKLRTYVIRGGSVLATFKSWNVPEPFPGNDFVRDAGLVWAPASSKPTTEAGTFNVSKTLLRNTDCPSAVLDLKAITNSAEIPDEDRWAQITETIRKGLQFVERQHLAWLPDLYSIYRLIEPVVPTPINPIAVSPSTRFTAKLEWFFYYDVLTPQEVPEHPSAKYFPGMVESFKSHSRTSKSIIIGPNNKMFSLLDNLSEENSEVKAETVYTAWHSTGLYAPPGVPITVQFASNLVTSFTVRIGCHTDDLTGKTQWNRFPRISTNKQFSGNNATITSPFGGLIYLHQVITDDPAKDLTVKITGGIETPTFFLEKTSLREWTDSIRHIDAPFAEFVSDRMTISVPGTVAQTVDDPLALMFLWENIVSEMYHLISVPPENSFQRMAFDTQISAGVLHSGYPIMGTLRSAPSSLNLTGILMHGGWGYFHELGHNLQKREWTLEGGGEVTCNIFAMYVSNNYLNLTMPETRRGLCPQRMCEMVEKYVAGGRDYLKTFAGDHDFQLVFYEQLRQLFGWDAYRKVFKAYTELSELPKTADDIRDRWLVIFSKTVGLNLANFFRTWGIPFSAGAEAEVAHLRSSTADISDLCRYELPIPDVCL